MYSNIQSASNSRKPAIIVKKRWMVMPLCFDVNVYSLLIEMDIRIENKDMWAAEQKEYVLFVLLYKRKR